ncbi:MAG: c-type cytochrome [Cyanobacteriota bacterium]|nr:c-type cytochrome [Cyanobacteriota bacterium]
MKKILATISLAIALIALTFTSPALADDPAHGQQIFAANCNACHMGGGNVLNGAKTLKLEALEKYGKNSKDAIVTQVTNGKAAMPAFGSRLQPDDIQDVASYVLQQAEAGW